MKKILNQIVTMNDRVQLEPQFICMTCKTVIGPTWDDDENQCNCKDQYDIEVWRVDPVVEDDKP